MQVSSGAHAKQADYESLCNVYPCFLPLKMVACIAELPRNDHTLGGNYTKADT